MEECVAQEMELVTKGGEEEFISQMIEESAEFKDNFKIFTTLIGKKKSLQVLKAKLENLSKAEPSTIKIFETTFYQGRTLR